MDVLQTFLSLENYKIKFTTGEGDYEGILKRVGPDIQLLIFTNLIWLPENVKMGTLMFRAHEIEAFTVIGKSEIPMPDPSLAQNYGYLYQRDVHRPTIFDSEFDESSVNDSELQSILELDEKNYIFHLPPLLANVLPLDNVIINKINGDFNDAIKHFLKHDIIGLSLEGPKIGRRDICYWLCISTGTCTFLFDIKTLGESAFDEGLRKILEDALIEKVVHDSREISDCLYHQYNTRLSNVFDTQVADFIINQQQKSDGKINPHVRSLNFCLSYYLDVPDEFIFRRKKRSHQDDLVFYNLQPVTDDLRDLFIKNVIYLRRLRTELDNLLMEPMHTCVDIYMKSVRCQTERELLLESYTPDAVPDELLYEGVKIFCFKKHVHVPHAVRSGPPYKVYPDSFKEYMDYCKKKCS